MNINQLINKALSTASEEEAMSCLRMARKRGVMLDSSDTISAYKGYSAKHWHDLALNYSKAYNTLKQDTPSPVELNELIQAYYAKDDEARALKAKVAQLEKTNKTLVQKSKLELLNTVGALFTFSFAGFSLLYLIYLFVKG